VPGSGPPAYGPPGTGPAWPPPNQYPAIPPRSLSPYAGGFPREGWPELAGYGSRVAARLIDWLIVVVIALLIGGLGALIVIVGEMYTESATGVTEIDTLGIIVIVVFSVALFLVPDLVYWPLTMGRKGKRNGQSLGMQMLGIRVKRDNEEPVSAGFAILRQWVIMFLLYGFVATFLSFVGLFAVAACYLWPLWDPEDRAVHDFMVRTHVVRA
jgi:uncharacterized RDD family membrane protein YckC